MSIVTLTGSNSFALRAALQKRVKDFVGEEGDLALERSEGEAVEFTQLLEAVQSLPFLANKKMVVVRDLGANKAASEKIEQILDSCNDTTDLVLHETKLDKRSSYYKILKKRTDFMEFNELDEPALADWLITEAKEQLGSLNQSDANYLIARVGTSQELLSNELAKLLSYDPNVSRQTIDLLTEPTPTSSIFDLLDAAFAGRAKRVTDIYKEQRAAQVDPAQIIAMLGWQLHALALIKTAPGEDANSIAGATGLNPYVVRKSLPIARSLSITQLKSFIRDALAVDRSLKTESVNADDMVQHYLLKLTRHI